MKELLKDLKPIVKAVTVTHEIEFVKTLNTQHTANGDGIVRAILEELTPATDDSGRSTFGEQVANLEAGLAIHGVYKFSEMYVIKKQYMKKRAINEGGYAKALIHYGRVFDSVVNKALRNKAYTLSKEEAKEYDLHKAELNKKHETFFAPVERVGESWLPVKMEDIAFVDDAQAGEWESGAEPYAGTSFLDNI